MEDMFTPFQKIETKQKKNIITAFEDDVLHILFEVEEAIENVSRI